VVEGFSIKISKEDWFTRFPGTGTVFIISTIFRENNIEPKEGIDYWIERWKDEYAGKVSKGEIKPVKGFMAFNSKLNSLGMKKIIATSSHRKNASIVLKSLGIEKEFDVVGSEDVRETKPAPDLFLEAARRVGQEPKDCIVLEDTTVGIIAAKRAEMKCVALTTTAPRNVLEKEQPDFIFNDYTEIDINKLLKV